VFRDDLESKKICAATGPECLRKRVVVAKEGEVGECNFNF
jgi:hypothetical protein